MNLEQILVTGTITNSDSILDVNSVSSDVHSYLYHVTWGLKIYFWLHTYLKVSSRTLTM